MQESGSEEVDDAIEVSRTSLEPELVLDRVVTVAVLHQLVHSSNLLQTAQSGLRELLHQRPRNLSIKKNLNNSHFLPFLIDT
jgi:hypothetical protein